MRYVSEEKQKNILNASAEVFAEKGYYQASIQNITQKAGVSTGTFYIYYKNKEEVLLAIYQRFFESLNDMIEKKLSGNYSDSVQKLIVCTASVIKFYASEPQLSLIMLTKIIGMSKVSENEYYKVFNHICSIFMKIIAETGSDEFDDVYISSVAYVQILNSLTAQWIVYSSERTLADLIYTIITYNFNALKINADSEYIKKNISNEIFSE
ncbi:MAG: TetR/AcrR family transcriptional regulator [Ruminococcus sp.]